MLKVKKRFLLLTNLAIYVKCKRTCTQIPRYLILGVLTLLPSGLLPILLQIFSKFRVHFAYFEVGIT